MPPVDVGDVLIQISNQNALIGDARKQQEQLNAQTQFTGKAQESNYAAAGEDARVVEQQRGAGLLQAQDASIKAARAFGTDISDPSEIMTSFAAQYRKAAIETNAAADQVAKVAQDPFVSFLMARGASGKPGAALLGGLLSGGATGKLQASKEKLDLIGSEINSLNEFTQQTAKTQASIAPTLSAAAVTAAADQSARQETAKALAIRAQTNQYNIEGLARVQQMSQQQLSNSVTAVSLQHAAETLKLQQEQIGLAVQEKAERVKLLQETEEGLNQSAQLIYNGMQILNGGAAPNISIANIKQQYKLAQQPFQEFYQAGLTKAATGQSIISNDAGKAAQILDNVNAQLPAEKKLLVDNILGPALSDAREGKYPDVSDTGVPVAPHAGLHKKVTIDIAKPNGVTTAANLNAQYLASVHASSIAPNDFSNIYQAPKLNSILALPAMKGNPLVEKVLRPQVVSGDVDTNFTSITDQAVAAVKAGTLTFDDAVTGINLVAKAAININNAVHDYKSVGIPEQGKYRTIIGQSRGVSRLVDVSSRPEVTADLSSRLLRAANLELRQK